MRRSSGSLAQKPPLPQGRYRAKDRLVASRPLGSIFGSPGAATTRPRMDNPAAPATVVSCGPKASPRLTFPTLSPDGESLLRQSVKSLLSPRHRTEGSPRHPNRALCHGNRLAVLSQCRNRNRGSRLHAAPPSPERVSSLDRSDHAHYCMSNAVLLQLYVS